MLILVKITALLAGWLLFYKILRSRNKSFPRIKATLATLLFATIILRLGTDLYASLDRFIFSLNAQGEIPLSASVLKIPAKQNANYCLQFTDENLKKLPVISQREDGQYCGEFWRFKTDKNLMVPYQIHNDEQMLYWASPTLKIIAPKTGLEKEFHK